MKVPGFKDNVRTVILKRFNSMTEAKIYEARLREANIPSFLSNINIGQLLPFHDGGIVMHIQEDDYSAALEITKILDRDAVAPYDDDFREADHDDIEFVKNVMENEARLKKSSVKDLLIIALAVIVFLYLIKEVVLR